MKKCKAYNTGSRYSAFDGTPYEQGYCSATKECDSCSCGGDELKCDFYEYIRERARLEQAAEMLKSSTPYIFENDFSKVEVIDLSVSILIKALFERSCKEKQPFPWWIIEEIYEWKDKKYKGE